MRKALVAALVVAFVLSIAATASAAVLTPASFPDVEGKACAEAVAKLEALGIGKGIDGKWMPELPVTRAQFAAFAVRLLGLEGVVKYMTGPTKFADVPATHWASGYVTVAVAKKLVVGYPDGNFHPDETINFAQAATVLGRLLGYVNLPGEWPANYMVAASEAGLFEGVEFTGDFVTRGDMAIMLNNALSAKLVKPTEVIEGVWTYEPVSDAAKDTLLEVGFKGAIEADFLVASGDVDASLKANEVKFASDTTKVYTVPAGVNVAALLGHKLNVVRAGTAVKYIEDVTPSESIVTGSVYSASATQIKVTVDDEIVTKDFAATKFIYRNKVTAVYSELAANDDVTVLLDDDGKALVVSAFKLDDGMSNKFVAAVTVKGVAGATATTIKVGDTTKEVASNATILKNGKAATINDIKAGDLVYIAIGSGKIVYVSAYDATVSGVVSKVLLKADGKKYVQLSDGSEYKLASPCDIKVDDVTASETQLIGTTATILLDKDGAARKITAVTGGVLVGRLAEDYVKDTLKVNVKGSVQAIPVDSKTSGLSDQLDKNDVVRVVLRADGVAKAVNELSADAGWTVKAVSLSGRKLTVEKSGTYKVCDVPSYAALYDSAFNPIDLSAVKGTVDLYLSNDVALAVQLAQPALADLLGRYVGYMQDLETGDVTVYVEVGGTVTEYVYASGSADKIPEAVYDKEDEVVKISVIGNKLQPQTGGWYVTVASAAYAGYTVKSVGDDGKLTLNKAADWQVLDASGAVVYQEKTVDGVLKYELKALTDVAVDKTVDVYLKPGETTKIAVLVIKE